MGPFRKIRSFEIGSLEKRIPPFAFNKIRYTIERYFPAEPGGVNGDTMKLIKTFTLNDFFNDTFKLLLPITKKTILPLILLFIPGAMAYGWGFIGMFQGLMGIMDMSYGTPDIGTFMPLIVGYGKLFLSLLLYGLAGAAAQIILINHMGSHIFHDRPLEENKALFSNYFGRIIVAGILQFLIFLGLTLAFAIVVGILTFLSTLGLSGLFLGLLVPLYIGFYVLIIWLAYCFFFSPFHIVLEDSKPWESLKKSFVLIKKNWWRFFGIGLLFSLCVSFAVSLVTSPLMMAGMIPSFSQIFTSMDSYMSETEMLFMMVESFTSVSFLVVLGIMMLISSVAQSIFMNIFYSLFYVDLKVRKGELVAEVEEPQQ